MVGPTEEVVLDQLVGEEVLDQLVDTFAGACRDREVLGEVPAAGLNELMSNPPPNNSNKIDKRDPPNTSRSNQRSSDLTLPYGNNSGYPPLPYNAARKRSSSEETPLLSDAWQRERTIKMSSRSSEPLDQLKTAPPPPPSLEELFAMPPPSTPPRTTRKHRHSRSLTPTWSFKSHRRTRSYSPGSVGSHTAPMPVVPFFDHHDSFSTYQGDDDDDEEADDGSDEPPVNPDAYKTSLAEGFWRSAWIASILLALLMAVFYNSANVTSEMRQALQDDEEENDNTTNQLHNLYFAVGEVLQVSIFLAAFGLFSSFLAWVAMSVASSDTIEIFQNERIVQVGLHLPMACVLLSIAATTILLILMIFLVGKNLAWYSILLASMATLMFSAILFVYGSIMVKERRVRSTRHALLRSLRPTKTSIKQNSRPSDLPPPSPTNEDEVEIENMRFLKRVHSYNADYGSLTKKTATVLEFES